MRTLMKFKPVNAWLSRKVGGSLLLGVFLWGFLGVAPTAFAETGKEGAVNHVGEAANPAHSAINVNFGDNLGASAGPNKHLGGNGIMALAVALGISVAALAGAFGQSRAAAAALEGIARNPNAADKIFVPMILGLAFIESLVLFTWVLMYLLQQKF